MTEPLRLASCLQYWKTEAAGLLRTWDNSWAGPCSVIRGLSLGMGGSLLQVMLPQAGATLGPETLRKSHHSGEPEEWDPVGRA